MSVTTAPIMPTAVANNAQVTNAATAMDAGTRVAAMFKLKKSRSTMLARSTMYPMNRKRGTATNTSLLITE